MTTAGIKTDLLTGEIERTRSAERRTPTHATKCVTAFTTSSSELLAIATRSFMSGAVNNYQLIQP